MVGDAGEGKQIVPERGGGGGAERVAVDLAEQYDIGIGGGCDEVLPGGR